VAIENIDFQRYNSLDELNTTEMRFGLLIYTNPPYILNVQL